jgi:hypothetical protein
MQKRTQTRAVPRAGSLAKKKIRPPGVSNAETRAAFRATRTQYRAAAASFHAHPKSVRTLAAGGGGLVGPFHDLCLNVCEKPAITTVNECFCQSDSAQNCVRTIVGGCG